jgi:hypothetical protein
MNRSRVGLTPKQAATLDVLADVIVPAVDQWPSASEAGVSETWVERALDALPNHHEAVLARVLDGAREEEPAAAIRRLEQEDPDGLNVLLLVVVGAYYLSPKVRRTLGWAGPRRNPPIEGESDYYLEGGILDPVVARGSIYRPTP